MRIKPTTPDARTRELSGFKKFVASALVAIGLVVMALGSGCATRPAAESTTSQVQDLNTVQVRWPNGGTEALSRLGSKASSILQEVCKMFQKEHPGARPNLIQPSVARKDVVYGCEILAVTGTGPQSETISEEYFVGSGVLTNIRSPGHIVVVWPDGLARTPNHETARMGTTFGGTLSAMAAAFRSSHGAEPYAIKPSAGRLDAVSGKGIFVVFGARKDGTIVSATYCIRMPEWIPVETQPSAVTVQLPNCQPRISLF